MKFDSFYKFVKGFSEKIYDYLTYILYLCGILK